MTKTLPWADPDPPSTMYGYPLTKKERAAVCRDCGCVAFKKSQHASGCPFGGDPTGAKLNKLMGRDAEQDEQSTNTQVRES